MSSIYLITLLLFLIIICIIITIELLNIGKREKSLNHLQQKLRFHDINHNEILSLINLYNLKKLWFSSIVELEKQLESNSMNNAEYYYCIGLCYFNIKLYNLAKNYYIKAIKIRPKYTRALNNLGKVYEKLNEYNKAEKVYQDILSYDCNNKTTITQLSNIKNRDSRI